MFKSILPDTSLKRFAKKLLLISLFFHLLAAWFNVGYYHPDEYFQIAEFASYKMGRTPVQDLAWEYKAEVRPALQPAMMYCMIRIFYLSNPLVISFMMRLISALAAWMVTSFFILISLKRVRSEKIKKTVIYLSMLLWFMPVVHARFSSENWSAIFFFAGLSCLLYLFYRRDDDENIKQNFLFLFFSGVLLGLSYVVHFQSGIMIAGLGIWLLFHRKLTFSQLFMMMTGTCVAVLTGMFIDRWFYGRWFFTAWNYFRVNIIENKTADFGVMPWWDYFRMIFINLIPPFSILVITLICIFFIRHPRHVLTWICLPFFLVHIMIGHKELRFLFPMMTALPVMMGLALDEENGQPWLRKLTGLFSSKATRIVFRVFIVSNVILMFIASVKPSNENFPFYNFIYSHYHQKHVNLYTSSRDPYEIGGLPVDFFKPEKLSIIEVKNHFVLDTVRSDTGQVNLFLVKGSNSDTLSFITDKKKPLYQNIPDWIQYFNFNNWLKRATVWRVYEMK